MTGQPDALIVAAATWIAVAVAGYLACSWARARSRAWAAAVAVVTVGVMVGGVAVAASPHPRPPVPSLDWSAGGLDRSPLATHVLVRSGDSLWLITARTLARPTSARVATDWPRWWRRNRALIGPDPNLIRPGQRLRTPGSRSRRP